MQKYMKRSRKRRGHCINTTINLFNIYGDFKMCIYKNNNWQSRSTLLNNILTFVTPKIYTTFKYVFVLITKNIELV